MQDKFSVKANYAGVVDFLLECKREKMKRRAGGGELMEGLSMTARGLRNLTAVSHGNGYWHAHNHTLSDGDDK